MDYRRQTEKDAEGIGACLEPTMGSPDLRGAYAVLKRWYRHTSVRSSKTFRTDMSKVTGDYAVLY